MAFEDYLESANYKEQTLQRMLQKDEVGRKLHKKIDNIIMRAIGKYDPKFHLEVMKLYNESAGERKKQEVLKELQSRVNRVGKIGEHNMLIEMDGEPLVSIGYEFRGEDILVRYEMKSFEKISEVDKYS